MCNNCRTEGTTAGSRPVLTRWFLGPSNSLCSSLQWTQVSPPMTLRPPCPQAAEVVLALGASCHCDLCPCEPQQLRAQVPQGSQPGGGVRGEQFLLLSVSNPDQTYRPHGSRVRVPGGQGQRTGQQGLETRSHRLEARALVYGCLPLLCDPGWVSGLSEPCYASQTQPAHSK